MQNRIRVLLVATPTLFRRSLASSLGRWRRLDVVGDVATAPEALLRARQTQPDVILVDPALPDGGEELVADLHREIPSSMLLALSPSTEEAVVANTLDAGARGYLDHDCEMDDLVHAIERVSVGELVLAPAVAQTAIRSLANRHERNQGPTSLTGRQLDVVRLVAQGQTNVQIARELFITVHTVKSHMVKVLSHFGLVNRVQLTAYAVEHRILVSPAASSG